MVELDVKSAISAALKEERHSHSRIAFRALFWGTLFSLLVIFCLSRMTSEIFHHEPWSLCISLWVLMVAGAWLVFRPQPRIRPRGYWSSLQYGQLLIGMTFVTSLQLIVCPEFAAMTFGVEGPIPFFNHLTEIYMSAGGMTACMFLCGLTFTALCATIVFGVLSHSFSTAPWRNIFTVIFLSLIGQGPVIVIQLVNEESRETFPFWLAGSVLALSVFGAGLKFRRPSLRQ